MSQPVYLKGLGRGRGQGRGQPISNSWQSSVPFYSRAVCDRGNNLSKEINCEQKKTNDKSTTESGITHDF